MCESFSYICISMHVRRWQRAIATTQDGAKFYMVGQCTDCGDVANSFRLLQWSEIVKMYQNKAAPQFKENFELARTRHHKLLEDPAAAAEWLPELVRRTSKTGIRISSWFKFFEEDDYIETFGVSPLLSRVYELLLEDGMTKEKGLLVPKLKGQDLSHIDYCRDVEVFREYDHELLKTLLEPQSAMRELESVDVCHDAHKRFMRDHAQASLFVCVLIVM